VSQVGDNSFNAAIEVVVNFAFKEVLSLEKSLLRINVYPSTASHFVKINSQKEAAVRFYTLDGTLALTYEKAVGKLDISTLKMGVYVLELVVDGELTL